MVTVKLPDPRSVWTVASGWRFRLQSRQADFCELLHAKLGTADMVGKLERRTREVTLLSPVANLLQSCASYDEAYTVITQLMPQLFPNKAEVLNRLSASRTSVDAVWGWSAGDLAAHERLFARRVLGAAAWPVASVRRPQPPAGSNLAPAEVAGQSDMPYTCLPLMAQDDALGARHLRWSADSAGRSSLAENERTLVETAAEHISLALSNQMSRHFAQPICPRLADESVQSPLSRRNFGARASLR